MKTGRMIGGILWKEYYTVDTDNIGIKGTISPLVMVRLRERS